ncbi:MAG: hypothetical protein J6M12_03815 [Clostridia bacterium]|nr:hypothetical protein [Clostridia bacterium]
MKATTMGIAGMMAGMMLGTAAGYAVKSMMTPKPSGTKKAISGAIGTVGEMLTNISKQNG